MPARPLFDTAPTAILRAQHIVGEHALPDAGSWVPNLDESDWWRDGTAIETSDDVVTLRLDHDGAIDTASLDALVIETSSARHLDVGLMFDTGGRRHSVWAEHDTGQPEQRRHRLEPAMRTGWAGIAENLQLVLRKHAPGAVRVQSIVAYRFERDENRAHDAAERTWLIDIDGDQRRARTLTPERPISIATGLPARPRLHCAVASYTLPLGNWRFVLRIEAETKREIVYEASIAGGDRRTRWDPVSVDLDGYAGQHVTLVATLEGHDESTLVRTIPPIAAWAEPILVDRDHVPDRPNLILVSIDTLRSDALNSQETPDALSIATWARDHATAFETVIAPAPWTLPSHITMLTGVGAVEHGVNEPAKRRPPDLETVTERLRRAGYTTAAITGGGWLHPRYGFSQGFGRFRYIESATTPDEEITTIVEQAEAWATSLPEPFFLFVHTFSVHDYFKLLPVASDLGAPGMRRTLYRQAVRLTDAEIGPWLERRSRTPRTAIILTSDHGEALGEDGETGHGSLSEHVVRVPLIVARAQGQPTGARIPTQVRTMDIAPTLEVLAGLEPVSAGPVVGGPVTASRRGASLLPMIARAYDRDTLGRGTLGRGTLGREVGDPHRIAASFFAIPGHGLLLRDDARWRYTFDDHASSQAPTRTVLTPLGDDGAADQRVQAARSLGAMAARLLTRRPRTATLTIRNRSESIQSVQVSGRAISGARLAQPLPAGARVAALEDGGLEVIVPTMMEAPLHLLAVTGELVLTNGPGPALRLEMDELGKTATYLETDRGWRRDAGDETGRLVITISAGVGFRPVEVDDDPSLRERLRNLGYLDG